MKTWQKAAIGIGVLGLGWLGYRWYQRPRLRSDGRIQVNGNPWINIPFEYNSAVIPEASYPDLERIAALITGPPMLSVVIRGHTDDVGPEDFNLDLGSERAMAVYYWLVDAGVPQETLAIESAGEMEPIADNLTPEGQALNRRVEFVVV